MAEHLRWEEQNDRKSFLGYSGEIIIGMVVECSVDGKIVWTAHDGVHMKWTAKTNGEARSFDAAKRAVERSLTYKELIA